MRNIPYKEDEEIPIFPDSAMRQRVHRIIQQELTQAQRDVMFAYYFQELTLEEIAKYRGISKSSAWKLLRRAEETLKKYLKY